MSGVVEAITGGARAISTSVAALIGKSSGSIRAMNGMFQTIYESAPAFIRAWHPRLPDYEVDEIVTRIVDDELRAEASEWSFVRFPDRREAIVERAVRYYRREQSDKRKSRSRADAVYLELRDDDPTRVDPESWLYAKELKAGVIRFLHGISPAHRATYQDVVFGCLSHEEAAERIGRTVSTVVSRMTDCNEVARTVARAYTEDGRLSVGKSSGKPKSSNPQR